MENLELNEKHLQIIVNALWAASPTGGGSDTYHLARMISVATDIQPIGPTIGRMQNIAHAEVQEYLDER